MASRPPSPDFKIVAPLSKHNFLIDVLYNLGDLLASRHPGPDFKILAPLSKHDFLIDVLYNLGDLRAPRPRFQDSDTLSKT